MAETAFLAAVTDFLANHAALTPTAAGIGIADPLAANELPALVLSLESVQRLGSGLGERASLVSDGALPWTATIDLASPFLPGPIPPDELPPNPRFSLLSADRKQLVLPHGGLRKADGSDLPLDAGDLQVRVGGVARTLVANGPGALTATQFRVDPQVGVLSFGADLPANGLVVANYVLGSWERRTVEIEGLLCLTTLAGAVGDAAGLSDSAINALLDSPRSGIAGLRKISVTGLSSIAPPDALRANARARSARFAFHYTHEINRPDSSGGIIRQVQIKTRLQAVTVDRATGAIQTSLLTELWPKP